MKRLAKNAKPGMFLMAALSVACIAGFTSKPQGGWPITGGPHLGPALVDLGLAGNYVILTHSGITTTGTTSIIGNLGVYPVTSTAVTGFGLVVAPNLQYSVSSLVRGQVYAPDYAPPTPAILSIAVGDMQHAYTDAAGRTSPPAISLPTELGGLTLAPGLYKTSNAVAISTNVKLKGGPNDVWIFQIAQGLRQASATRVILTGGARASHVFWQVAGVVSIGTTADMEGEVLGKTGITLNAGATVTGRLLAQTNVTLIANAVTIQ
jgi:hypothetical protein